MGTTVQIAPSRSAPRPRIVLSKRNRCSTTRYESHAGTSDNAAAATATHAEAGAMATANTISGQCHRYQL